VREIRPPGSVRGAARRGRPYRDARAPVGNGRGYSTVEAGPVGCCGQARPWLRGRHERGCPRLRGNHRPEAVVLPTARVVILSRQRPQAATREHDVRVLAPGRLRSPAWTFAVRQLWRRSRPVQRGAPSQGARARDTGGPLSQLASTVPRATARSALPVLRRPPGAAPKRRNL
jgi:hypothetical protein